MTGSIVAYETADGRRYRVRYRRPDKKSTDKSGFRTKREAETFLASVTISKVTGDYVDPSRSKVTVGSLGPEWLRLKRRLKPSYVDTLERDWRVYVEPMWGTRRIGDIKPSEVTGWVQDLLDGTAPTARSENSRNANGPRSASVVLRCLGILRGILDAAVEDQRITRNPAAGIKSQPKKDGKSVRRYLTDDKVARLVRAVPDPDRATLILVLAYTGIRWGEAVALRVRDLNPLRRRLHVRENAPEVKGRIHVGAPKSWEKRTVPYPQFLDRALERVAASKGPSDLLFPGDLDGYQRRPTTAEDSTSWFRLAVARAGLERLTLHDLRHTAASLAVASGAHVKVVQKMLGHKSAAMTLDTYADFFDGDLDEVAQLMGARAEPFATAALAAHGIPA